MNMRRVDSAYEENLPFFAYGTLRPGASNDGVATDRIPVGASHGSMDGVVMYHNRGMFPYLIERSYGGSAVGTLLYFSDADFFDASLDLDMFEGYFKAGSMSNSYERVIAEVQTDDGPVRAYVYMVPDHRVDRIMATCPRIDSGDWFTFRRPANAPF